MEKLVAKHDHKLTDILKVAIFALFLIMPGIMFLPSCMYYAINKYATPPTSQVENTTEITLKQGVKNGKPISLDYWHLGEDAIEGNSTLNLDESDDSYRIAFSNTRGEDGWLYTDIGLNDISSNKYYVKFNYYSEMLDNSLDLVFYDSILDELKFEDSLQLVNESDSFISDVFTSNNNLTSPYLLFYFYSNGYIEIWDFQLFNLTQIFGSGNEPTKEVFESYLTQEYYEYNVNYYVEIPNGTYTTYTDIPKELDLQWQSLWNKPILKWTNTTILKQGLDNFTYVFGITQTSYINNLITYELIMVAIYIVIDIVLTLFKWLTHLIGEK